ncbi:MAG: PfkB family carbohydrate kinase [Pseudomonadota bacterium]|nr:PfkB family carbohydrate kinase [Pseudomonadota bacterium]
MSEEATCFDPQGRRVVCLGLAAFDYLWQVVELPEGTSAKVRAHDFLTRGGGMAATAAVAVARLGGEAAFWGRAGQDREGEEMKAELATERVDVDAFRLFACGRSSISGVFVDPAGERHIANFRGEALPVEADWLPLADLKRAGALLADPRWPEGAEAAFRSARDKGVPTVLDADVADREVFERLLPFTDHAIFSEPALAAFAGRNEADALAAVARHGCRIAAVTKGSAGVSFLEAGNFSHLPAFDLEVVDTTGAGDVFHGAYALAIAAGLSIHCAMGFAAAAAALKCTQPGGRQGIPTFDETMHFWSSNQ